MPKLKTNSGAKKRFKHRGNGSVKSRSAYRNHILTKKSQKRKRQLRGTDAVKACDVNSVARMLCDK
ncbi:MAG: 50S ribosomal protein L35 [Gammaproteobacteria bacterium RIFCSPLOWO2_02_FULL_42_14]|nr:MAG: 50S ribosomal protein L35 [Gammaproteobacteria bacterium RIFCSPHIGHO2_02_FULL_42_43]OGT29170.1 MAG: 50S ribosomal protein L35 [Gammaproteobacteria bacterium RIFCSPHIGHO2_01_FULL_42_8]OGT51173.1 MAG: 50S ribosomal protein L35 [Gammaproteobacteria bacterium RIFCSPHIGHO2_12_FULL_41_25]OGT62935.1 MAG: 50S ribosomal protein L35 [Gammaproteobacteria bacterium RIFCSPLOWO2_02_FULL_42_14]OGT86067.1 MAG: 50S ribosomal protein L35 [Gammaproteobacteria bacterium RIFCSPLOWO2_12_FULL_42_18]